VKTVQPIRDKQLIESMKIQLADCTRNVFLFTLGINTGLRISDLLKLKVNDVRDVTHIIIIEQKTKKPKRFKINDQLKMSINEYTQSIPNDVYLFKSRRGTKSIKRVQAWKILNQAAKQVGISEIGTHTLRKTFGYHFYQKYKDVAVLQQIFNHSSPAVTMRYIGINQDIMDEKIDGFTL
jgi:integrase